MKAVSIALLAVAGLMPTLGFADLTPPYSVTGNPSPVSTGGLSTLDLPQFNTSLGTLNGATVQISWSIANFSLGYTANASYGADILDTFSASSSVSGAGVGSWISSLAIASSNGSGQLILAPGASGSINFANLSASAGGSIDAGSLNSYKGTGTVPWTVTPTYSLFEGIKSTTGFSPAGPTGAAGGSTFSATITYDYTPIPEPSTYAMILGACTLGLVGWRRFRK